MVANKVGKRQFYPYVEEVIPQRVFNLYPLKKIDVNLYTNGDMIPLDTTIAYKVSLLLLFQSNFGHNSLGSTCICHYLLVGANVSQSASPSKLLCHRHGLVIHNWDPGPSWSTPHEDGEHIKKVFGCPPPWPPPQKTSKGVQVELDAQSKTRLSLFGTPGTARTKTDAQAKTLPMAPISGLNSIQNNKNHRNKMTSRIYLGVASPFFGLWAMYRIEPIRGATRGVLHNLNPLFVAAAAIVRLWVLLRFILSRTIVTVHRFVGPQL